MSDKLSNAQRLAKFFTSKEKFEAMKADSEKWVFDCESCGKSSSIWDVGGIRFKAKGNKKTYIQCPKCGNRGMKSVRKID